MVTMIFIKLRAILWGVGFGYLGDGETFIRKTECVEITVIWKEHAESVDDNVHDTKVKKDVTGLIYIVQVLTSPIL